MTAVGNGPVRQDFYALAQPACALTGACPTLRKPSASRSAPRTWRSALRSVQRYSSVRRWLTPSKRAMRARRASSNGPTMTARRCA